jgi:hypothetical protein
LFALPHLPVHRFPANSSSSSPSLGPLPCVRSQSLTFLSPQPVPSCCCFSLLSASAVLHSSQRSLSDLLSFRLFTCRRHTGNPRTLLIQQLWIIDTRVRAQTMVNGSDMK